MIHRRRDPIIAQLRQRLVAARHLGTMQPGDRLPAIRKLAQEFGTTQRVIMAALRELSREGHVEFKPRLGVYLAGAPRDEEPVPRWLVDVARPVFREAVVRGYPATSIPMQLERLLQHSRARVMCVECNDDHADALCRELDRDYGFESRHVDVTKLDGRRARQLLAKADLVVTTPYHEVPVRAVADEAGLPFLALAIRNDLIAEVEKLLASGAVFFIGTDVRYERKLKRMFAGTAGSRGLRVHIIGRDDLDRIPERAPVYVMERAWRRLGGWPRRRTLSPIQRLIDESAIDRLLQLVIDHNLGSAVAS